MCLGGRCAVSTVRTGLDNTVFCIRCAFKRSRIGVVIVQITVISAVAALIPLMITCIIILPFRYSVTAVIFVLHGTVATGAADCPLMLGGIICTFTGCPVAIAQRVRGVFSCTVTAGAADCPLVLGRTIGSPVAIGQRMACIFIGAVAAQRTSLCSSVLSAGVVRP